MNPYIHLPRAPLVQGRQEFILTRARGKRVLHLGCVDRGLLAERFARGDLMHQRLAGVAADLWGVDIDREGIEFLRAHGFPKVVAADVSDLDRTPDLQGLEFDLIVASEILEHLSNPGLFLGALDRFMAGRPGDLVVTVPNAFRVDTLLSLFRGVEYVHPDHVYWFSYHTVTHLLRRHGFEPVEVCVYTFAPMSVLPTGAPARPHGVAVRAARTGVLRRAWRYARSLPRRMAISLLYRTTPFWGDGLIVVARVPRDAH